MLAWRHRQKLRSHPNPGGWLVETFRRCLMAQCRKLGREWKRQAFSLDDDHRPPVSNTSALSPESFVHGEEQIALLHKLLGDKDADIFLRYCVQGESARQLAADYNMSESGIRVRVSRLKKKLLANQELFLCVGGTARCGQTHGRLIMKKRDKHVPRPLSAGMQDTYTRSELLAICEGELFTKVKRIDTALLQEALYALDERPDEEAAPHRSLVWSKIIARIHIPVRVPKRRPALILVLILLLLALVGGGLAWAFHLGVLSIPTAVMTQYDRPESENRAITGTNGLVLPPSMSTASSVCGRPPLTASSCASFIPCGTHGKTPP